MTIWKIFITKPSLFVGIFLAMLYTSCSPDAASKTNEAITQEESSPVSVRIEAESFTAAEGEAKIEEIEGGGKIVLSPTGNSWLAFDVNIPVAGRYRFQLHGNGLSEKTSAWMEDYVENKDGRTYNITGTIPMIEMEENSGLMTFGKEGSPLNAGIHKMKLHLDGGIALIDWLEFTLLKEQQITPKKMTQQTTGKEWKVVWSDEFEGTGIPDTSKWTFDIGDWGWGNNELQYYTEGRSKNARQENGNLIIEAHKNDDGHAWTSARLTTRGKVSFVHGRIEIKAKVPPNRGNWAAGWTLGDQYVDELSWPYCGEIDILESVGYEMEDATGDGKAHASVHCGAYYFKLGNQPTSDIEVKNMNDEYHLYAIDWTPEGITASVDGNEYFEYKDTANDLSWPFDKAQNIILNLAMGGGWGGLKGMDENMQTQQFIVDYVRVYEKR